MENINEIFVASLKFELESRPRGTKRLLAESISVSAGHFSDILNGRRGSSEEQRRTIATVLGYSGPLYDLFLERGQDLIASKAPIDIFENIKLKPLSLIPKTEADMVKLIARTKRDRLIKEKSINDPDVLALNKIIHPGCSNVNAAIPLVKVPLFDAGAGEPCEFRDDWRTYDLADDVDFVYVSEKEAAMGAFGIKINGDSMAPTIEKGDTVIVMPTRYVENGKIVLACWPSSDGDEGKRLIKRYKSDGKGNAVLWSDNPAHEPIILDKKADRDVRLFRVTKLIKDL